MLLQENLPAVNLWLSSQTQWRVGFAGATGLDYTAVAVVAGALGLGLDLKTLGKVQTLEALTLERWHKEGDGKDKRKKTVRKPLVEAP